MITIDQQACVKCGQCAQLCVMNAISRTPQGTYAPNGRSCINCGHCFAVCPVKAVDMDVDTREVLEYEPGRFMLDEDELLDFIRYRRSVRRYTPRKLSREQIEKILQAGRYSATGSNAQTVEYIVLDETLEAFKADVWRSLHRFGVEHDRPDLIRRAEDYQNGIEEKDTLFYGGQQAILVIARSEIDGGIAAGNMELMAYAMGLGVLYCGFAVHGVKHSQQLQQMLGLNDRRKLIACMVVGRPNVVFQRTVPRKPVNVQWM
ncbi:MAG: nitroreductase family protein [Eubacteriales bacterium]|nr:nitroreductase family protein [Eubacteriales bacterium]